MPRGATSPILTNEEAAEGWTVAHGITRKVKLGAGTKMSPEMTSEALQVADEALTDMEINHPKRYDKVAERLSEHFHKKYPPPSGAAKVPAGAENQWQVAVGSRFGSMVESRDGDFLVGRIGDYTQIMIYRSKKNAAPASGASK